MTAASKSAVGDLSFEAALAELEKIVSQLETGQVPLEKSIEIYERGAALKTHCEAQLKAAELKVQQIVQSQDGQVALQPAELTR